MTVVFRRALLQVAPRGAPVEPQPPTPQTMGQQKGKWDAPALARRARDRQIVQFRGGSRPGGTLLRTHHPGMRRFE